MSTQYIWRLSLVLLAAADVHAAEAVSCPPNLTGGIVPSVEVKGGECEIVGTGVTGDIKVESGGLVSIRDAHIGGHVISNGGQAVRLQGGVTVKQDLSISGATDTSGFLGGANQIQGNFRYQHNSGYLIAHHGTVGHDMVIRNNTGGASVVGNSLSNGTLVCEDNDPAPTGFDNKVNGTIVGQCEGEMKGIHAANIKIGRHTDRIEQGKRR